MKKFIVVLLMLTAGIAASAQSYDWSIGIRGGATIASVDARFLNGNNALDFRLSLPYKGTGMRLDGNYEWCMPVFVEGMEFYYGPGLHFGVEPGIDRETEKDRSFLSLGFQGVAGLEYKIPSVPIAAFIDYRPGLYCAFGDGIKLNLADIGLGIRVTFNRNK